MSKAEEEDPRCRVGVARWAERMRGVEATLPGCSHSKRKQCLKQRQGPQKGQVDRTEPTACEIQ